MSAEQRAERLQRIERNLQAYGDGPPCYSGPEAEAFGRAVSDIAFLHRELKEAYAQLEEQTANAGGVLW